MQSSKIACITVCIFRATNKGGEWACYWRWSAVAKNIQDPLLQQNKLKNQELIWCTYMWKLNCSMCNALRRFFNNFNAPISVLVRRYYTSNRIKHSQHSICSFTLPKLFYSRLFTLTSLYHNLCDEGARLEFVTLDGTFRAESSIRIRLLGYSH